MRNSRANLAAVRREGVHAASETTASNRPPGAGGGYPSGQRNSGSCYCFFFFQAEDGIRDLTVTGVQTCALPILRTGSGKTSCPCPVLQSKREIFPPYTMSGCSGSGAT